MTRRHSAALALLAALALGGCKLASFGEADVSLELLSPALSRGRFTVVMRSADASEGTLYVDGVAQPGALLQGEAHVLDVAPHGVHRMRARVVVAGRAYVSDELEVTVDSTPPRLLEATGSVAHLGGPIHVSARFDEPLAAGSRLWTSGAPFISAIVGDSVTADAGPIVLDEPGGVREVRVSVEAHDALGNYTIVEIAHFAAPQLRVTRTSPDPAFGDPLAARSVTLVATWTPDVPVDLTLDGAPYQRLLPGVPNVIDLLPVPGGTATFGFDAPGALPAFETFRVRVDHTPPEVVWCKPSQAPADDPSRSFGFICLFDETVVGVPHGVWTGLESWSVRPPLEAGATTWSFDLAGTTDVAGNALVGAHTFTFPFHPWRTPHGADPVALGGVVERPTVAVLDTHGVLVERANADPAGRLRRLRYSEVDGWWEDPWAIGPVLAPSGLVGGGAGLAAWLTPDGQGGVRIAGYNVLDPTGTGYGSHDLEGVAPATAALGSAQHGWGVSWAGPAASGLQEGWIYSNLLETFCDNGCWQAYAERTRRVGTDPAVDVLALAFDPPLIALVEADAPGLAHLRVQRLPAMGTLPLESVGGVLNRDPAVPARSPSVDSMAGVLVWVEAGVVLARTLTQPGDVWSPPVALNDDEANPARWPSVYNGWITFVERHPDGDHIELRSPIQGGAFASGEDVVPGDEVASLSAGHDPIEVLWQDSAGAIRHRLYNR